MPDADHRDSEHERLLPTPEEMGRIDAELAARLARQAPRRGNIGARTLKALRALLLKALARVMGRGHTS